MSDRCLDDIECRRCGARLTDTEPPLAFPMSVSDIGPKILDVRLCEHDFEHYYLVPKPEVVE